MRTRSAVLALPSWAAFASEFARGRVTAVDQSMQTVTLEHGNIENLDMPRMTMMFRVSAEVDMVKLNQGASNEFKAGSVDDEITVLEVK